MSTYTRHELSVGAFVALGAAALAVLSVNLVGLSPWQTRQTTLSARFSSVGSLKAGDPVKIAGVTVGSVEGVQLVDFEAEATFSLTTPVKLPEDSIASIQSAGLLGDAYVSLSPGASDKDLPDGGRITRTEPAVSLTELIGKYAFGSPTEEADDDDADEESPFDDPLAEPLAKPTEGVTANGTTDEGRAEHTPDAEDDAPKGRPSDTDEESPKPSTTAPPASPEKKTGNKKSPFEDPLE